MVYDNIRWCLCSFACGIDDAFVFLLSPNSMGGPSMRSTPRYYSVNFLHLICSIAVVPAVASASYVAVLTTDCNLLNKSNGA